MMHQKGLLVNKETQLTMKTIPNFDMLVHTIIPIEENAPNFYFLQVFDVYNISPESSIN